MDIYSELSSAVKEAPVRPKGIRLSVGAFKKLEAEGHITRASGGPLGLDWFPNMPWFDKDIYAWCDVEFEGAFQLPAHPDSSV